MVSELGRPVKGQAWGPARWLSLARGPVAKPDKQRFTHTPKVEGRNLLLKVVF